MRKEFGPKTWVYPQMVMIIATYNEDGTANAMNAAWGGVIDYNQIIISLAKHATTKNFERTKAFTVSFGTVEQMAACDYVGLVSGNDVHDKVTKAGWTISKASKVNAPIINELPLTLECEIARWDDGELVGQIVNVSADESILDEAGNVDPAKLNAIIYDGIKHKYRIVGEAVGDAFSIGNTLK